MRSQPGARSKRPSTLRRVDCVSTIITKSISGVEHLLLVWNSDWRTPAWSLPGGERECHESLCDAAVREVHEETGLYVEVDDLVDLHEIIGLGGRLHLVVFTFAGRVVSGSLITNGSCEPGMGGVSAARWHSVDEARAFPAVARVLDSYRPKVAGVSCSCERRMGLREYDVTQETPGLQTVNTGAQRYFDYNPSIEES